MDSTENSLKYSAAECKAAGMKIRYVVLKQVLKLSLYIKLSVYQSISIPLATYGHELQVVMERKMSSIHVAQLRFICGVTGLTVLSVIV